MKPVKLVLAAMFTALAMNAQQHLRAVDVHSHIVTDDYLEYLRANDALMEDGYPLPTWDKEAHLAFMDSVGISRSILSLSSPQPWFGSA